MKRASAHDFNQFKTPPQLKKTPTVKNVIQRLTSKLFVSETKKFEGRKSNGQ